MFVWWRWTRDACMQGSCVYFHSIFTFLILSLSPQRSRERRVGVSFVPHRGKSLIPTGIQINVNLRCNAMRRKHEVVAAPPRTLLVGVLSMISSGLVRRDAIRRVCSPSAAAHVLFVLPANNVDALEAQRGDVLPVPLPNASNRKRDAKYLLQNGFYRAALQFSPSYRHIARADDDTLFNASAIAAYLWEFRVREPSIRHIVYGAHQHWYMWHPGSMQAACIATNWKRWADGQDTWRERLCANASSAPVLQGELQRNQCLHPSMIGPFPFAAGPFVAYSRELAEVIISSASPSVPGLDVDERYVVMNRSRQTLFNAFKGTWAAPSSRRSHPSRQVFFEEVYYAFRVYQLMQTGSVALLHAWMSEYKGGSRSREDPPGHVGWTLFPAHFYHHLKKPSRQRFVEEHASTFLSTLTPPRPGRCRPLISAAEREKQRRRLRTCNVGSVPDGQLNRELGCERWLRCEPSNG